MCSIVTIVNNTELYIYLKVAERVDPKISYHKKKNRNYAVMDVN